MTAMVDSRVDPEALLRAFDRAMLRGSGENPLADYDGLCWATELASVFGPAARVIAGMQLAIAEQEIHIGALEARLSDVETKREQPYHSRAIGDLIAWVSKRTGIAAIDIRGASRQAQFVTCRQAIAWVAHEKLGHAAAAIARRLGERNHSTIITAIRRAASRRELDADFRALTDDLLAAFTLQDDRIAREFR